MKKYVYRTILTFLCLFTAFFAGLRAPAFSPAAKAHADQAPPQTGDYACILQENTLFYSSKSEGDGLFILPTTYFVRLLEYGKEFCRVEYLSDGASSKKLVGYARTERLTFVPFVPVQPYPDYTFTLSYRIDEGLSENSDFLNEITLSCTYYGTYAKGGKLYCYVLRGETFGYVPKPENFYLPESTEYTEYLAAQTPTPPPSETPVPKESSSPAQIAILVALCLLVPVLAALILKPPRRPPYDLEG